MQKVTFPISASFLYFSWIFLGDKFSTLSEIPVNWELSHSGDGRPLRIVPFEQSTYEAPPEIMALESNKKKGNLP